MIKLNKALLASAAIAFAGGLAVPASAQDAPATVVKSGKKMKIKLYGEVSRVFGLISDGTNMQVRQGQNANTASRMGIEGRGRIKADWSLRTRFEFELVGDTSLSVTQNQSGSREQFRIRHTDAAVSIKHIGTVSIGLGDTASNGVSEVTLVPGGTAGHLGGSLHQAVNGVIVLDADTGAGIEGIGSFFDGFDGAGRATRIRYDTPAFEGTMASASYIDGASWDVALRFNNGIGGTKFQGAVGFARIRDGQDGFADFEELAENIAKEGADRLSGSLSIRTPIGLGVTVAGAGEWRRGKPGFSAITKTAWNINPSLWYTMKATEVGPTTVEYAYQHTANRSGRKTDANAHAITLFQVLEHVGTDTFLTFRYYDVAVTGFNPDNIWVIGGGFRARF